MHHSWFELIIRMVALPMTAVTLLITVIAVLP